MIHPVLEGGARGLEKRGEMGSRAVDKYPDLFANAVANVKVGGTTDVVRSLANHPGGFSLQARNSIGDGWLDGIGAIKVDGQEMP